MQLNKKIVILFTALAFLNSAAKASGKVYDITKYGARADGITNNTVAIQKAIDEAAVNGGMVLIPAGKFVTGVITLKSNVELHLAANAALLATTKRIDYGAGNASALILADGQHHIAITGKGTIDGQGDLLIKDIYRMLKDGILKDAEWQKYNEWHQMRPAEDNRPKLIQFKKCDNITIKNVTIKNGLDWIQDYRSCTNMVIDSIKVESNTYLNNDGIDLVDCKNVRLTNSSFNVADDGICLKSHDPKDGCDHIYIADCSIRSSASAFKLGTASRGAFRNITVRNLKIYDTYRSAIALESVDGAVLEHIDIRNVTAKNTGNAIFIRLGKRQKNVNPGSVNGIYIANVKVQVPAGKPDAGYQMEGPEVNGKHNVFPSSIVGIPGYPVQDVTLENIDIVYEGGAKKEVAYFNTDTLAKIPEQISDYPEFSMFGELPAWGFYVRHAANIKLKNVSIGYKTTDFRTACVFDDVSGLNISGLNVSKAQTLPVVLYHKVSSLSVQKLTTPYKDKRAQKVID
ncbi:glycoside hydrolase family 28 protein [Mucilaginibacter polytrichastri]|uniref:Pectate lyase superfamily protein domain-containing protein n=1 Tax=Mucilaginibacter polytrichastri TaxID=1302689 RepID=A0A1Q5ZUM5_9SPHI|nr:glycosyl hydrolase family 28 protein [Mucilaginibacter polytrichastri]OKS85423.1 hypothetical protein RG47T_0869 [Mucilaginibacter polytrichastri]SFS39127.1 Polygalacturonase [Mucilaginibacter polytrichastri]